MSQHQHVADPLANLLPSQRQPELPEAGEATRQLVVHLDVDRADEAEADALTQAMQDERFDLRRKLFLALVLDFGQRRDSAFRAVRAVAGHGWESTLYADPSGWVVRLTRTRRVTQGALLDTLSELKQLARRSGGQIRGLTVEDLRREDRWDEMAAQLQDRKLRSVDDPDHVLRR